MTAEPAGTLLFVFHSHLPYVLHHGKWPHGVDWLCEAAAESYIPLLDQLTRLHEKGIRPKVTVGITPVLAEQLAHPAFAQEFNAYLQARIDAADDDEQHFRAEGMAGEAALTEYWRDWYAAARELFNGRYGQDILGGFRRLQDAGAIEVITSAATHGYLPLLAFDSTVQAQIKQGVRTYERHFGRTPRAVWLPECAYRPSYHWRCPVQPRNRTLDPYLRKGIEEFLAENGLKCFFVENHLLVGGTPAAPVPSGHAPDFREDTPVHGLSEEAESSVHMPHYVSGEREGSVAFFARDDRTGSQVWSARTGYPGDPCYLDFHKKRLPGALRYWRVTGPNTDMADKLVYDPEEASRRTTEHAEHFAGVVRSLMQMSREESGRPPAVCAPYDTELFGHWWFEGVSWLGQVIEALDAMPDVRLDTVSGYLEKQPPEDSVRLPEGSWGSGGFHQMWLNPQTTWTWELVYEVEARMSYLASKYGDREDLTALLKQAAREVMLLTASDWQFNISTGASKDYAEERVNEHYNAFMRLADMAERKAAGQEPSHEEWGFLGQCEERDDLFGDIDPAWFGRLENPLPENAPATVGAAANGPAGAVPAESVTESRS